MTERVESKMDRMYTGHIEDIFEEANLQGCSECGGSVRIVLVDFNNRELATECNNCKQAFSLSHDIYGSDELHRMLDVIKEERKREELREAALVFKTLLDNAEEYMREEVLEEVRDTGLKLIEMFRGK